MMNGEANLLQPNTCLKTNYGELRIIERLGGGSQGDVYSVWYNSEKKALKWYYKDDTFLNKDDFIYNLKCNIEEGSPAPEFLWPLDMTAVDDDGRFGYVMDLVPEGFVEGEVVLCNPNYFPSFRRIIDTCLNITKSFMLLHDNGYVYRDISGKNFFVNPVTGAVLICDNDNVAPSNRDAGVRGTATFRAPEVFATNMDPTEQSDLHSLAIVIFRLLLMHHALEGKRLCNCVLDETTQKQIYGTEPLFIFDPDDTSNAPLPGSNPDRVWPRFPVHMQQMFQRAFSQKALLEPRYRPKEIEWVRELVRLRSEVVACPHCGTETFLEDAQPRKCANPDCGCTVRVNMGIEVPRGIIAKGHYVPYIIPVANDTRIYRCQVGALNANNALDPVVWMLAANDETGTIVMKNVSKQSWQLYAEGVYYDVRPEQCVVAYQERKLRIKDDEKRPLTIVSMNNERS